MPPAVGDGLLKILRNSPVAASRNLIVAVLLKVKISLNILYSLTELRTIIPVALKHGFRHFAEEFFGMMPEIIRPYPRP